jgi:hypothetical protein
MLKLSDTIARVSRSVATHPKLMTLAGKETHAKFTCKTCLGSFLLAEAYVKDKSKSKNSSDIRPYCVTCWIEHNGKTYDALKKEPSTSSLSEFLPED